MAIGPTPEANSIKVDDLHLLSAAEIAKQHGYARDYVSRLCRQGKVRGRRVANIWYVDEASFLAFTGSSLIVIDDMRFLLAAEVAKRHGYVRDYVARLCRTGKVRGRRIANSWYVDEDSFLAFTAGEPQTPEAGPNVSEVVSRVLPTVVMDPPIRPTDGLIHARVTQKEIAALRLPLVLAGTLVLAIALIPMLRTTNVGMQPKSTDIVAAVATANSALSDISNMVGTFFGRPPVNPATKTVAIDFTRVTHFPFSQKTVATPESKKVEPPATRVSERIVERISPTPAMDTTAFVTRAEYDQRLAAFDSSVRGLLSSSIGVPYSPPASGGFTNVIAMTQKIDKLSGVQITGGTISGAAISGGSVTATAFDGLINVASGGTGTSTLPSYGQLLVGDNAGGYSLMSTSSLGIVSGGSPGGSAGEIQYNDYGTFAASPTFAFSTSTETLSVTGASTTNATSTNLNATNARLTNATTTILFSTTASSTDLFSTNAAFGTLSASGNTSLGNATTSILFSATASSTNLFSTNATFGALSVGTLSISSLNVPGLSTFAGFLSTASSTIGGGTQATGLTVSGGATTTGTLIVQGTGTSTYAGDILIAGSIVPSTDNTFSLGTASKMWKDVFIGPGSLYINGQKVLEEDADSIIVSADADQNVVVQTSGTGDVELNPSGTGLVQLKGNVMVSAGKTFNTTDNSAVRFTNGIRGGNLSLNGNELTALNTTGTISLVASSTGGVYVPNGSFGIATSAPLAKLDVYGNAMLSGASRYLNFGDVSGTSGYGFRDNAGSMEFKNTAGAWTAIGSTGFSYLFPSNATSTLLSFGGGLTSYASTTIGDGTQSGSLTVWGGATTTGNSVVLGTSTLPTIIGSGSSGGSLLLRSNISSNGYVCLETTNSDGSGVCLDQVNSSGTGSLSIFSGLGGNLGNIRLGQLHSGNSANTYHLIDASSKRTNMTSDWQFGWVNSTNNAVDNSRDAGIAREAAGILRITDGGSNYGVLHASYIAATSTTASRLTYASTTALSASTLCLTGDTCLSTWPTAGFDYPFPSNATSTAVAFSGGLSSGSTLTLSGSAANIALGSNYLSGDGGDEGVFVSSAGNVGIGTASPTSADVQLTKTAVGGNVTILSNNLSSTGFSRMIVQNDSGTQGYFGIRGSSAAAYGMLGSGEPFFYTTGAAINFAADNASGVIKFASGGVIEKARFDAAGNFGIGTTSPYAKLSVVGQAVAAYFTATTSAASTFPYASTTALSASAICISGDCQSAWPAAGSSFSYPFPSNATTTAIDFSGGLSSGGTLTLSGSTANIALGSNYLSGDGADEGVFVSSSGSVGIGTASPEAVLHIKSSATYPAIIEGSDASYAGFQQRATVSGAKPYIEFYNSANNKYWGTLMDPIADTYQIWNTGSVTPRLTINSSGNVGIGTTSPYAKLSVGGQVVGAYFTATTSVASTLPYASSTALTATTLFATLASTTDLRVSGTATTTYLMAQATSTTHNNNYPLIQLRDSSGVLLIGLHSDNVRNVFLGNGTGRSNTITGVGVEGLRNIFVGLSAGQSNTTGYQNFYMGYNAARGIATGASNVFIGASAGEDATGGNENFALGSSALFFNSGSQNVGIGSSALYYNRAGNANLCLGYESCLGTSAGTPAYSNNIGLGYRTLSGLNNAANGNVAIGYRAGNNITTGTNNIVLGYDVDAPVATASNQLTIGNLIYGAGITSVDATPSTGRAGIASSSPFATFSIHGVNGATNATLFAVASSTASATTTHFVITNGGLVGIGTSSPWRTLSVAGTVGFSGLTGSTGAGSLCLDSNNQVVYNSGSDNCLASVRAVKHDIKDLRLLDTAGVERSATTTILALSPVSFVYNWDASSTTRFGFIADDVLAVDPHLVTYDASGEVSGVDDRSLLSVVVKAIKEILAALSAFAQKFTTKELCVEDVCVTRDQFLQMVQSAGAASSGESAPEDPSASPPSEDIEPPAEPAEESAAEEIVTEEFPVETPGTDTADDDLPEEIPLESPGTSQIVPPEPSTPEATPAPATEE